MWETTAQIAAFCTEQGLGGWVPCGWGGKYGPTQQGQDVGSDTPKWRGVEYHRKERGGLYWGGDTFGVGGGGGRSGGRRPEIYFNLYIYIYIYIHTYIHTPQTLNRLMYARTD